VLRSSDAGTILRMSFDPIALPDDVEALHRLIAVEREELAAARAGLMAKALEIE
jgi:hypothetical protein